MERGDNFKAIINHLEIVNIKIAQRRIIILPQHRFKI
jgi:hypothetical protein